MGHSEEVPGGVDAVVGTSDPRTDAVDATAVTLSGIRERMRADLERWFVVTRGDESTAARGLHNTGLCWFVGGLILTTLPVALVLFT